MNLNEPDNGWKYNLFDKNAQHYVLNTTANIFAWNYKAKVNGILRNIMSLLLSHFLNKTELIPNKSVSNAGYSLRFKFLKWYKILVRFILK